MRFLRRIVRFWIGPLVRWASVGHRTTLFNVFDGAAYVAWVDAFGVAHEIEFPPDLAKVFCDDLLDHAFRPQAESIHTPNERTT